MNFSCKFMLNSLRRGRDKCVVLMMNSQRPPHKRIRESGQLKTLRQVSLVGGVVSPVNIRSMSLRKPMDMC
jgi:hypothetical protein